MRKLWYAGAAVASGFLLFGASAAQADDQPAARPGNSIAPRFGDLLSGGWGASGDSPFGETESAHSGMSMPAGLGGALPGDGQPTVPDASGLPGGGVAVLAPAVTDPAATDPAATDPGATDPAATDPAATDPTATDPAATDPAAATPTAPVTANPTTAAPTAAAPTGAAPTAAASTAAASTAPAKHTHKVKPAASASADSADPRLHEEPVDGEAAQRTFSQDDRPVAGVDQQNK